jgi:hypothetical protein
MILGLSGVESVGLWTGIIVGVASVVLALVAIYFSLEVDRRSAQTAASTIKALERIDGAVQGQSRDTRDLIKVGWERMLGNVGSGAPLSPTDDEGIKEIAAGLAAEIRAGLAQDVAATGAEDLSGESSRAASEAINELRETLESQLRTAQSRPGDEVQFWIDQITRLSEEAQAVLRLLARQSHITAAQMRKLQSDPDGIRDELHELRRGGFLVPLEGYDRERKKTLVYWLPPGKVRALRAALTMLPEPNTDYGSFAESVLEDAGYPDLPS